MTRPAEGGLSPAEFVSQLVKAAAREHVPRFGGRFSLHGHSAGAQFAGRYLVTHPQMLKQVILSAPGTLPMPDPGIAWPYGMGTVTDTGGFTPERAGWRAAGEVSVTVLVGSRDTEPQWPAPGQSGTSRIERATGWVARMRQHAGAGGKVPTIQLVMAEGLDHDEEAMAIPAQEILARAWRRPGS